MLKLRPPRLRERIGLIVLLHLLAMIAVILLFLEQTDMRKMAPLYRVPVPEKVALVVTAFERTGLAHRAPPNEIGHLSHRRGRSPSPY
ncbi:hypothetical protein ACT9ST_24650 (plasmid) [Sphingobium limneticum]